MNEEIKIIAGLTRMEPDKRDFSDTAVFGVAPLTGLPKEYIVKEPLGVKHQHLSDFCTAFAGTAVSEDQENTELSPEWQFAQIKRIEGRFDTWGANLRHAGLSFVKYGSIPAIVAPPNFNVKEKDRDFLADHKNWSEYLYLTAKQWRKKSMFFVDGPYDTFDNIRAALWNHRHEECSIVSGANWQWHWTTAKNGIVLDRTGFDGVPHAFKIMGFKEIAGVEYIIVLNSSGENVGYKGMFYFNREIVNREFTFESIMFNDLPKEDAKIMNRFNLGPDTPRWKLFIYKILMFLGI